ncbi:MAG: hypothetical protein V1686_02160 [Patescibacteria group bacterium]
MLPKGSIAKVYKYYFTAPEFSEEVMCALREFYNRPDLERGGSLGTTKQGEIFFNEWFLYDFVLNNGYTPIKNFIITNPFNLNELEMKLYKDLLDSEYGMFEVLDMERSKSLTIKDLQTNKKWLMNEYRATFDTEKGYVFFGRIGKVDDHYELIGADTFSTQDIDEVTKKSFRKEKFKLTPKTINDIFRI